MGGWSNSMTFLLALWRSIAFLTLGKPRCSASAVCPRAASKDAWWDPGKVDVQCPKSEELTLTLPSDFEASGVPFNAPHFVGKYMKISLAPFIAGLPISRGRFHSSGSGFGCSLPSSSFFGQICKAAQCFFLARWNPQVRVTCKIHPRKLTWIPKITIFERRYTLKTDTFRIHGKFRGGGVPLRLPSSKLPTAQSTKKRCVHFHLKNMPQSKRVKHHEKT